MSTAIVFPSSVSGTIQVPASKSAVQRAFALALLRGGDTLIFNAGESEDENAARNIIRALGAVLERAGNVEIVYSTGIKNAPAKINCGESGLSLRMFTPIASMSSENIMVSGRGTLLKRPLKFFDEVLPELGVKTNSNNGYLPLELRGPLIPKHLEINGPASSQYITGLLFAYASSVTVPVELVVKNLKSKPYVDLSVQMLNHFGFPVREIRPGCFLIEPPDISYECIEYRAEGDWSSASFMLVAAAISGEIKLTNLKRESLQADKAIFEALEQVGAAYFWEEDNLVCKNQSLKAFSFDAADCPDLFPPLAALAANCQGVSQIKGISRLADKESDRSRSILETLSSCGVEAWIDKDGMLIRGSRIHDAVIHSFHDHRIAMMASILALNAEGPLQIESYTAVNKSYPGFFRDLQNLGVKLKTDE